MKKQSIIKSVESKINVADQALVSAITRWKKNDNGFNKKEAGNVPQGFENINWSSAFAKISGNVEIAFETAKDKKINHLSIPFNSWFLFSCTKEKEEGYKIGWAVSLS